MKHAKNIIITFATLTGFVVSFVFLVQLSQAVEADRTRRFKICRAAGETNLTCGIMSVFGAATYDH